jgi:phosphoribosylanthranilate isomerase
MSACVRVKICGITNYDDAMLAVELGADALGFIFFPRSLRYIEPDAARAIIAALPPFVTPVAVVVNEPIATVSEIMSRSGCHLAQLHGNEPPGFLERLAWPAIKGISIASALDLVPLAAYTHARAILLDTKVAGQYGGTGTSFDWILARDAKSCGRPIIMAGGLNPENIVEAIRIAQPHAVDIGSGVEQVPGKKDPDRLRRLFAAITAMG